MIWLHTQIGIRCITALRVPQEILTFILFAWERKFVYNHLILRNNKKYKQNKNSILSKYNKTILSWLYIATFKILYNYRFIYIYTYIHVYFVLPLTSWPSNIRKLLALFYYSSYISCPRNWDSAKKVEHPWKASNNERVGKFFFKCRYV